MNLDDLSRSLQQFLLLEGGTSGVFLRLVESLGIVLLFLLLQRLIYRVINQNVPNIERRHQLRVWIRTFMLLLAVIAIIALWSPRGQTVLQVLALLAAGLALTLSRPITSILAWMVIILRGLFRVGDRIQAGDVKGDVVDIGILHVHLLEIGNWVDADQSTGRIVHVPNTIIFDGPVFNYTEGFDLIWNEMEVVLSHDSDWERARSILLELATPLYEAIEERAMRTAEKMGRRYAYQRGVTTPFVYVKLLRDGISLTLRYLTDPRRRRGTHHNITVEFLKAIRSEPEIRLAAPMYRIVVEDGRERGEQLEVS